MTSVGSSSESNHQVPEIGQQPKRRNVCKTELYCGGDKDLLKQLSEEFNLLTTAIDNEEKKTMTWSEILPKKMEGSKYRLKGGQHQQPRMGRKRSVASVAPSVDSSNLKQLPMQNRERSVSRARRAKPMHDEIPTEQAIASDIRVTSGTSKRHNPSGHDYATLMREQINALRQKQRHAEEIHQKQVIIMELKIQALRNMIGAETQNHGIANMLNL